MHKKGLLEFFSSTPAIACHMIDLQATPKTMDPNRYT